MVIYRLGLPYYKEFDNFQFAGLRGGYNGSFGFPLWGKLSPQVTDEGATSGYFSLIRRVPRHLPPKGKAFPAIRIDTLRRCAYNKTTYAT